MVDKTPQPTPIRKKIRSFSRNSELISERRDLIARTAVRLFAQNGYDRTSIREIASACGLNHATIYHYVGSKEDLMRLIVQIGFAELAATSISDIDLSGKVSATDNLRTAIRNQCRSLEKHFEMGIVTMRDISWLPPDVRKTVLGGVSRGWELFEAILRKGCETGEFEVDDVNFTARNIALTCQSWVDRRWAYRKYYSLEAFIEKQTQFIINGIAARKKLPKGDL